MKIYNKNVDPTFKSDGSPVTEADNVANEIITEELKKIAPSILIVSEENQSNHFKPPGKKYFLVDPLDGTKEFLKRDGKGSFTMV